MDYRRTEFDVELWATADDAYHQYQIILYHWLRFIGSIMGQDIFCEDFTIDVQTVLVAMINLSLPLLLFLTYCRFDNELGMMAGVFLIAGPKVTPIENYRNHRFLNKQFVSLVRVSLNAYFP